MTTIVLKDWYYENCVSYPAYGAWFLDWGIAICRNKDAKTVGAFRTLRGEILEETEKAIKFECRACKINSRCDIIKTMQWTMWLPKKGLVEDMPLVYFNGGEGQYVDKAMFNYLNDHKDYTLIKTWAFK